MVQGTRVAIVMGEAMTAECRRWAVPADLADDLAQWVNDLIVATLKGGNNREDRKAIEGHMKAVVETFAVAVGAAWTAQLQKGDVGGGDQTEC